MRGLTLLSFISIIFCSATLVAAQSTKDDFWRKNLGIFDGLVLRCTANGVDVLEEVCENVGKDFDFLTATADIASLDCSNCSWFEYYAKVGDAGISAPLRVDVLVASTKSESHFGGFAQVSARADFDQVVCLTSADCDAVPINPDVQFWMKYFTFTSDLDHTTASTLSGYIEGHLKGLITIYVKASRTHE